MNQSIISSILTGVVTAVFTLEQLLPGSGLGATKKEIALNLVKAGLQTATVTEQAVGATQAAAITGVASQLIDSTVSILNKAGVGPFAKTTTSGSTPIASGK